MDVEPNKYCLKCCNSGLNDKKKYKNLTKAIESFEETMFFIYGNRANLSDRYCLRCKTEDSANNCPYHLELRLSGRLRGVVGKDWDELLFSLVYLEMLERMFKKKGYLDEDVKYGRIFDLHEVNEKIYEFIERINIIYKKTGVNGE